MTSKEAEEWEQGSNLTITVNIDQSRIIKEYRLKKDMNLGDFKRYFLFKYKADQPFLIMHLHDNSMKLNDLVLRDDINKMTINIKYSLSNFVIYVQGLKDKSPVLMFREKLFATSVISLRTEILSKITDDYNG